MSEPSDQITFALGRLAVLWRAGVWQAAAAEGLNPAQAEILGHLARRGPVRQVDLAAALGVSAASLSDSVASLAAKGLVMRQPDPDDGRARRVALCVAGQHIAERLATASDVLTAAVSDLPAAESGSLLRMLTRLIRALQEARAIPVQRMCATCTHFRPHAHADAAYPHHCAFVDAAFGDAQLRLDCGEHEAAPAETAAAIWRRFEAA
ncbi:MarR family winged helix-turn-helix transcriptional regulator [Stappia sp. P2PMeth1]|uniref:MarR family winged helix-turn-helix transcriptional regulator n=1 Tax=Stappia sp. P2PMeth1 TaxID=2003586 RepID=UPI0016485252|nr:MarR family winged helix-turn-helix transcriptional regulator [Stappia sp. P2PMeth1]